VAAKQPPKNVKVLAILRLHYRNISLFQQLNSRSFQTPTLKKTSRPITKI